MSCTYSPQHRSSRSHPVRSFLHVCLVSALFAGSAQAATYTVTTNGGDVGTPCVADGADFTCDNLRDALAAANASADDDTITFDAAVAGDIEIQDTLHVVDAAVGGTLTLQGRLDGAGAPEIRLHGGDARRVLFVEANAEVVIHSLAIVRGFHDAGAPGGGGILNEGELRIESSVVADNAADVGGGIYNHFNPLTIVASRLSNNLSAGDGGGLYINAGEVTIEASVLLDNMAAGNGGSIYSSSNFPVILQENQINRSQAAQGGGIYINDGEVEILKGEVSENIANATGGGIHINAGDVSIQESQLIGNIASDARGGGIYITAGDVSIQDSRLEDNTANGANSAGGGISNDIGVLVIEHSILSGNTADSAGGISNGEGDVTIERSTLSGNEASVGMGGGIFSGNSMTIQGTLNVRHSTISGNTSPSLGGGFVNAGTTVIEFSTVTNNTTGLNDGGGFSNITGGLTLTASIIANNTGDCELAGGATTATGSLFSDDLVNDVCFNVDGGGNISADPLLGPLADNGGSAFIHTHLPQAGSPALDAAGNCAAAHPIDQRGVARPQGAACDIGAVELATYTLVVNVAGDGTVTADPLGAGGIDGCVANCQEDYPEGTSVDLIAVADAGWAFFAWDGDCVGQPNPATVVMGADYACQAIFIAAPAVTTLAIQGGNAQATAVLTAFGNALSVLVTDAADAPVAGVTVDFAAVPAGNGASALLDAPNAVTAANGVASVNATANGIAGNYIVTVDLPAHPAIAAVNFALENEALATALVLVVDPVQVAADGTITLTATLAPVVPGAVVDFLVDGNIVCTAVPVDAAGVAECANVGPFGPGAHQAQAVYAGGPGHNPANIAAPFNVQGAPPAAPVMVPVDSPWALALLIALMSLVGLVLVPRQRG